MSWFRAQNSQTDANDALDTGAPDAALEEHE
jgi:hypothetical protein